MITYEVDRNALKYIRRSM